VVANVKGEAVQRTDYYPFGMPHPNSTEAGVQPYKFGGKEYDTMHGLNLYDFEARQQDPILGGRFTTPDPLGEKRPWESLYAFCGNNPVINVDPTGEDYWSTNDPELIRQFLNSTGRNAQYYDFSGWSHATDAQFTANLTYNDNTGKFYTSYTTVENGEVTAVSKSFDASLKPVSLTGQGYPGAFVYNYAEGMGGLYGLGYNAAQYMDISAFVSNLAGFDPYHYGNWNVNDEGRITGLNTVLEAKQQNMGRSAAKYIKGYGAIPKGFHTIKNNILKATGLGKFEYKVGSNPDVSVVNGKIVLQGSGGGFLGKTYSTGLNANDFLP
jgi:RHS repeat-associated protein